MPSHMMDMMMPKRNTKEGKMPVMPEKQEQYPYGLKLHLENDQIKKLPGLVDVNVGDMVDLHAVGKVTTLTSEDAVKDGKKFIHRTMCIQIQKLAIGDESQREKEFAEED